MPLHAAIAAELVDLIDDLREQMIDGPRLARLNQLLAADEECRVLYIRSVLIDQTLHSLAVQEWKSKHREAHRIVREKEAAHCKREPPGVRPEAVEVRPSTACGESLPSQTPPFFLPSPYGSPLPVASPLLHAHPSPSFGFFGSAFHGTVDFFSQEIPFACLIATLFIIVSGIIGSLITHEHYTQWSGQSQSSTEQSFAVGNAADKARAAAAKEQEGVQWVGRITGMVKCKWSADKDFLPYGGNYVSLGRKYKLDSGLMEITYDTGAKVILEGPCTYEVASASGGFLSLGKLTGKVEVEKAQGFFVRTPTAIITDLGTEFGVEVSPKGPTLSFVFQGRIAVQAVDAAGQAYGRVVTLTENQSIQVAAEGDSSNVIAVTTSDTAGKTTAMKFVRTILAVDRRSYSQTVLADRPLFYWTFDEPDGPAYEKVRHLAQQALQPEISASRCSHAAIGSGLNLGRAADFSKAAGCFASNTMGMRQGEMPGAWAIEFWVQRTTTQADRTGQCLMNAGVSIPDGPKKPYDNRNPAVIFNWPKNAVENELQLMRVYKYPTHGGPVLADDRWHHIILVFYGNGTFGVAPRVDAIVDGDLRTIDLGRFSAGFNLNGRLLVGAETLDGKSPFRGRIDELAFYDLGHIVTIAEIEARIVGIARRHIEAAQPKKKEVARQASKPANM